METGGGLVPMEFFATQIPQFTLYGDGTAVFEPQRAVAVPLSTMTLPQPDPPFLTAKLTETEVQELLDSALDEGHLAVAKESYSLSGVADAPTTLFTIHAGGYDKSVEIYALGISEPYGNEADDRAHMAALASRLANFTADPGHDQPDSYDPALYRVTLFQSYGPSSSPAIEWPWSDISVSDFRPSDERPGDVLVMSREQVAKLTNVPNGGQMGIWVARPYVGANQTEALPFEIAIRPLLPDEIPTAL